MYNINSSVLQESAYTAAQLQAAAKAVRSDCGFNDFQAFVNAEKKYGINALFMMAHAAVESAWGTSYLAQRNNLFGFNAIDSNPNEASNYSSQAAAIDYYAHFLKEIYLTAPNGQTYLGIKVGRDYHGTTMHDIFEDYSTSHDAEATTVAQIMDLLVSHIHGNPQPVAPAAPAAKPESGKYAMQKGDTFWALEIKWKLPHGTLQALNPGLNPNDIPIGHEIAVPTADGSHAAGTKKYTIVAGNTFWALENKWHLAHGALQGLNPGVNANDLQIGSQINVPAGV